MSRSSGRGLDRGGLHFLDHPPLPFAGEEDVVALDHLVEGGRLQAEQAGRVLLHAAGGLEGDSMRRRSKFAITSRRLMASGGTATWGRRQLGLVRTWSGMSSRPIREVVVSTTPRSMTFSSSRTLPGQS